MFETVTRHNFIDRFRQSDTYKNNFSYEGLSALFDHLEEIEDQTGEPIQFDHVAIACEFSEYDSFQSVYADYPGLTASTFDDVVVIYITCGLTDSKFHNCKDHGEVIIRSF